MPTKKELLKEIEKLKKNEILKIVQQYCPISSSQKGGFLFFEETERNNSKRNNKKNNNKNQLIRQEIVFDPSKLVKNNEAIMNNNKIYNVIDYE